MELIFIMLIILIIIICYFTSGETFEDCSGIEGVCTSKLCPLNCKPKKKDNGNCYCIER
jgi:hypothetical protein